MTEATATGTRTRTETKEATALRELDVSTVGTTVVHALDGSRKLIVRVLDPVEDYLALLKQVFDFAALKAFLQRQKAFTVEIGRAHV